MNRTIDAETTLLMTVTSGSGRLGTATMPLEMMSAGTILASRAATGSRDISLRGSHRVPSIKRRCLTIKFATHAIETRIPKPTSVSTQGGRSLRKGRAVERLSIIYWLIISSPLYCGPFLLSEEMAYSQERQYP